MKSLISALLLAPLLSQAATLECAQVYVFGESCANLQVEFDFKKCPDKFVAGKPQIKCNGNEAVATVESKKYFFTTLLKRFVGKKNNAVWDTNGEVQQHPKIERVVSHFAEKAPPQPLTQTAVSAPVPAPAPSLLPPAPAVIPFAPTIKHNVLLQLWYVDESHPSGTAADANFRTRRAEIKLSGAVSEASRWYVSADFAKALSTTSTSVVTSTAPLKSGTVVGINSSGDNKVLQDLGVGFKLAPELEIIFGQFKILTASESLQSSSELLFAERSLQARAYGERRDPGVQLVYKKSDIKAALIFSNGQGANLDDKNNSKDISARVDAGVGLGISLGAFAFAKDAMGIDPERYGINIAYLNGDYLLRAELINAYSSFVRSSSVSVDSAYKISDAIQLATRYEILQPDLTDNSLKSSAVVAGVNYFIAKHNLKLQLNHSHLYNMNGSNGSYSSGRDLNGSLITFSVQNNF